MTVSGTEGERGQSSHPTSSPAKSRGGGKMCQTPKPPNPRPNGGREEEEEDERDMKKQALVQQLSLKLSHGDSSAQIEAARDIRKFARASVKFRSAVAVSAVVEPLVAMLSSADLHAKESALLALLNLAVRHERNKEVIVKSGVIPYLIDLLKSESNSFSGLATAAVLTLSASTSNRPTIVASGVVPLLVQILASGTIQSRVDAVTALYNLSNCEEIPKLTLCVEATRPLLTLLKDCKKYSKFAEKATALLETLSQSEGGLLAISETEHGILTLVETVEEGSLLSAERAVGVLLSLCKSCREKYREIILNEGPIPGLLLLTVDGSNVAQHKAKNLLGLLRDEIRMKRVAASDDLDTIVYSIASRVKGPKKAQQAAKRLMRDMVQRNMELSMLRIQDGVASSSPSKPFT